MESRELVQNLRLAAVMVVCAVTTAALTIGLGRALIDAGETPPAVILTSLN